MKIGDLFLVIVAGYVIYKIGFVDGWTTINLFILVCLIIAVISTILTRTGVKARMKAKQDAAVKAQEEKKKAASSGDPEEDQKAASPSEPSDVPNETDKDKEDEEEKDKNEDRDKNKDRGRK